MRSQSKELEEFKARTQELDKVAKMLVRRDLELSETRARREQELEKIELIFSNLSDGLILINGQGKLELFNPAAEQMFGVRARDILGRTFQELETFPRLLEVARIVGEKKEFSRYELPVPPNKVFEISAILLRAGEAKDQGVILVSRDITKEKQVEQLKTEFVSLAAHQLRSPLSAMKWAFQALLDGDAGPVSQEQMQFLDGAYRSNERMIGLVGDLLEASKIEEGKYLYRPEPSQIEEIIENILRTHENEAKEKRMEVLFQRPARALPKVIVDREKIKLAIENVIDNAFRYTSNGGRITISCALKGPHLEVAIADTGIGITQLQQQRVFERFFRADNAKKIDTEGSGLGLYLAKNIVEAHGGKIWFVSKEQEGTTFTLSLPLADKGLEKRRV